MFKEIEELNQKSISEYNKTRINYALSQTHLGASVMHEAEIYVKMIEESTELINTILKEKMILSDNKKEVLTGVNGNLNRFLNDVENEFRGKEFKDSHELQEELDKYLKDNITRYIYFESIRI